MSQVNPNSSLENDSDTYSRPSDLTGWEMQTYDEYLERLPSPCGGGQTIQACIDSRSCVSCTAAASFIADGIRAGFVRKQIEARYRIRFDSGSVKDIRTDRSPSLGPSDAVVTIVEFADFQCPFCASLSVPLHKIVKTYAPDVRLVFKHYPIGYHPQAEAAAYAAVAAMRQGKFWQLHDIMFAEPDALKPDDIEKYARSLNIDMRRFVQDRDSALSKEAVQSDYREGSRLEVKGTPAIFINGRSFDIDLFSFSGNDLVNWIELEIKLKKAVKRVKSTPSVQ